MPAPGLSRKARPRETGSSPAPAPPAPLNRRARRAAAALEGRKKAPAAAAKPARRPPVKPGEFDAQAVEDFLRARWFAIEAEMNK